MFADGRLSILGGEDFQIYFQFSVSCLFWSIQGGGDFQFFFHSNFHFGPSWVVIIFKSIFIRTAEISFSPSVSDNHTGCLFFNCPSIPSVLKRKNPWSQLELVVQRKYKFPIEKASGWLQVVFVFSTWEMGSAIKKAPWTNWLRKAEKKSSFYIWDLFLQILTWKCKNQANCWKVSIYT